MSVEATVKPRADVIPDGTAVAAFKKRESEVARREGRTPIPNSDANGVLSSGSVTLTGLTADTDYVLEAWVDELQSLKVDATAGKYKLKFEGQETADITFNATATKVRETLEALSNVAPGDVEVTGGPGNSGGTTPYVIKFLGVWAGQNVGAIEVKAGSEALSGGGAAATLTTTTQGSKSGAAGIQRTYLFRSPAE